MRDDLEPIRLGPDVVVDPVVCGMCLRASDIGLGGDRGDPIAYIHPDCLDHQEKK